MHVPFIQEIKTSLHLLLMIRLPKDRDFVGTNIMKYGTCLQYGKQEYGRLKKDCHKCIKIYTYLNNIPIT